MDPRQLQGDAAARRPRRSSMTLLLVVTVISIVIINHMMVTVISIVIINHMMVNGTEEIRRVAYISSAPSGSSAVPPLALRPSASRSLPSFCQRRSLPSCGVHAVMSMNKVCCPW